MDIFILLEGMSLFFGEVGFGEVLKTKGTIMGLFFVVVKIWPDFGLS